MKNRQQATSETVKVFVQPAHKEHSVIYGVQPNSKIIIDSSSIIHKVSMCNEARVVNESNSQVKYSCFDYFVLLRCDVMSLSDRFPTSLENILHDTNASPLS